MMSLPIRALVLVLAAASSAGAVSAVPIIRVVPESTTILSGDTTTVWIEIEAGATIWEGYDLSVSFSEPVGGVARTAADLSPLVPDFLGVPSITPDGVTGLNQAALSAVPFPGPVVVVETLVISTARSGTLTITPFFDLGDATLGINGGACPGNGCPQGGPQLVAATILVPEVATAPLLALGVASLARRRRGPRA